MSDQHDDSVASEDAVRLQLMKNRMTKIQATELKVRKLNHVLGSMAVSERPRQLSLLKQATVYANTIAETAPAGLRASIVVIGNELQSIREGIMAEVIRPKDMVLLSGVRAVKTINEMKLKLQGHITRAESRLNGAIGDSPAEHLLLKTKELSTTIPNLNGKDYAVIRAPIAFTFTAPNGKHSSVGYVDSAKLQQMGFKVDNLEGYTIIHGQMLIGVNTDALYVHKGDKAKGEKDVVETIYETGVKFKADKPIKIQTKRPKTMLDIANDIVKLIEAKTKVTYSLVSTTPARHGDAMWYWAAPAKDLTRMGKAFPGGHLKLTHWGPAFPVTKNELEEKRNKAKEAAEREKRGEAPLIKKTVR